MQDGRAMADRGCYWLILELRNWMIRERATIGAQEPRAQAKSAVCVCKSGGIEMKMEGVMQVEDGGKDYIQDWPLSLNGLTQLGPYQRCFQVGPYQRIRENCSYGGEDPTPPYSTLTCSRTAILPFFCGPPKCRLYEF